MREVNFLAKRLSLSGRLIRARPIPPKDTKNMKRRGDLHTRAHDAVEGAERLA